MTCECEYRVKGGTSRVLLHSVWEIVWIHNVNKTNFVSIMSLGIRLKFAVLQPFFLLSMTSLEKHKHKSHVVCGRVCSTQIKN